MGFDNSALMYRGASGQYGTYKDIDNLPFDGFYRMSGTFPSGTTPPGINYGIIINMKGGGYGAQISIQNVNDSSTTQVFARVMINATWSPWASLT